jgi:hypothetical protein
MNLWKTFKALLGFRATVAKDSQSLHQTPPLRGQAVPVDMVDQLLEVAASAWGKHVSALMDRIHGKVVAEATAGHSGYMLRFDDEMWVICFVDPETERMDWRTGFGTAETKDLALMRLEQCADASWFAPENLPYAANPCRIEEEVRNTIGKAVQGLSLGTNSYNLCFPEGLELEATVFTTDGKPALRVFWEQW